jgi:four helix bundle protein
MTVIKNFEEMVAWQRARRLNRVIYSESNNAEFKNDFALKNQIRKSSISIMSNIAEGFERNSQKEFKYFLNVAKGSAGELRSQLYIALDLGYINNNLFDTCHGMVSEISKMLYGFMKHLDRTVMKNNE